MSVIWLYIYIYMYMFYVDTSVMATEGRSWVQIPAVGLAIHQPTSVCRGEKDIYTMVLL